MSIENTTAPEVKPAPIMEGGNAALLAGSLGAHAYDNIGLLSSNPSDGYAYNHQSFNLGMGNVLIGEIHGNSMGRSSPGYPSPTIPEAEAIRAEIIRRWNCHAELLEALKELAAYFAGEDGAEGGRGIELLTQANDAIAKGTQAEKEGA